MHVIYFVIISFGKFLNIITRAVSFASDKIFAKSTINIYNNTT